MECEFLTSGTLSTLSDWGCDRKFKKPRNPDLGSGISGFLGFRQEIWRPPDNCTPFRKFHFENLVSEFSLRKFQIVNLVSEIFIRDPVNDVLN